MSITAGTLRYYATAARFKGVPRDDLDDAAQDIAIALLRRGVEPDTKGWKMAVSTAAIDTARRYGWHTRSGRSRETVSLDNVQHVTDPYGVVDAMMDTEAAIALLSPREQAALLSDISGMSNVYFVRRCRARKRLRELAA